MNNSKVITDEKRVDEVLTRGVDTVIVSEHLRERMLSGERLRIKFGIDPTSPHMHLGHTVPLRKLRQFQDLGHQAVLIIGDATAMIGDPTGRSEQRKQLTKEEVDANKKTYIEQAGKIIDIEKTEVRHNGEWFHKMSGAEFLGLTSLVTFAQVMQREDFRQRMDTLSVIELTYPIMQGYDSVMVKADVEIGGADQLLNLHMGRRMQRKFDQTEQDLLTVPLIEGTDGIRKMSKSFGNNIPLESEPNDMFGLTMTIPDDVIIRYFQLLTDLSMDEITQYETLLAAGENPRNVKVQLAWRITRIFHGEQAANAARKTFEETFSQGIVPENIPEIRTNRERTLIDLLLEEGIVASKSEARQKIREGAITLDDVKLEDPMRPMLGTNGVLKRGKKQFYRLRSV